MSMLAPHATYWLSLLEKLVVDGCFALLPSGHHVPVCLCFCLTAVSDLFVALV